MFKELKSLWNCALCKLSSVSFHYWTLSFVSQNIAKKMYINPNQSIPFAVNYELRWFPVQTGGRYGRRQPQCDLQLSITHWRAGVTRAHANLRALPATHNGCHMFTDWVHDIDTMLQIACFNDFILHCLLRHEKALKVLIPSAQVFLFEGGLFLCLHLSESMRVLSGCYNWISKWVKVELLHVKMFAKYRGNFHFTLFTVSCFNCVTVHYFMILKTYYFCNCLKPSQTEPFCK